MTDIRPATSADAARLADLAAVTFPLATTPGTDPADIAAFIAANLTAQRFAAYLADDARALFVAEDGDEAVGYTMLVIGQPSDADVAAAIRSNPTAELSKVYVRATHHGSGVAAALVAVTVDEARRRGAAGVWLGVNSANPRANAFYEKQGFVVVGRKRFTVGERVENDFVRERSF